MRKLKSESRKPGVLIATVTLALMLSACGKSGARFNLLSSSMITGPMDVTATSWAPSQMQGNGFFSISFQIQDKGNTVNLSTLSQGAGPSGAFVDGQSQQYVGGVAYSVQTECLYESCTQFVALFNAVSNPGVALVQVAVLYNVDSQRKISTLLPPVWNKGYSDIHQAAYELQSDYIARSGAS